MAHISTTPINAMGPQAVTVPAGATLAVVFWSFWVASTGANVSSVALSGASTVNLRSNLGVNGDLSACGVATITGLTAGAQTLTVTPSATPSDGPAVHIAFFDGINVGDYFRDSDAVAALGTTPATATIDSQATDFVIGMDQRYSAPATTPPANESGWTSVSTGAAVEYESRVRTLDAPGASTSTITSQGSAYSTVSVISIKAAGASTEQTDGRIGEDNGSESTHTLGTTTATVPLTLNAIVRALLNDTGDMPSAAYTLYYQKNGGGVYLPLPIGATTTPGISYVGGQVGGRAGATSTPNITFALTGGSNSTPQAGDLVVITVVVATQGRTPACAISGYSALTQINANGTTYDTSLNVSYKFMGGTPDTQFTLPSTGNVADAQRYTVQVWRGVDTTIPLDVAATAASGTATGRPNPGSITPSTAGAYVLICGGGAAATGASYTAPANYTTNFLTGTTVDTNDAMVGSGYRAWTSGGEDPAAYTGGTTNAADSWACYTLALRPAVTPNGIYIAASSNIADGGVATTARMPAPSGKTGGDFQAGRLLDDANSWTGDLAANKWSELGFCVTTQSPTVNGDYFDFRIYAGASPLSNYGVTPRLTVGTPSPVITGTSSATPGNGSSLTITGNYFGASQGSGSVTIGEVAQTVTSWGNTEIVVTVARGTNKYGVSLNVVVTDGSSVASNSFALTGLQPQAGWAFVNLSTPHATADYRITAVGDLASGDQLAYDTVSDQVEIFADATFWAATAVTSFAVEAWTPGDGWGASGLQTFGGGPGLVLQADGSVVFKANAGGTDRKVYLLASGAYVARTSPVAGDRLFTLLSNGSLQAGPATS